MDYEALLAAWTGRKRDYEIVSHGRLSVAQEYAYVMGGRLFLSLSYHHHISTRGISASSLTVLSLDTPHTTILMLLICDTVHRFALLESGCSSKEIGDRVGGFKVVCHFLPPSLDLHV